MTRPATTAATNPEWAAYVDEIRGGMASVALTVYERHAGKSWHSAGRGEWKCCSPLRPDKSPSWYAYKDGGWHDFGTGESGDLISFLMALLAIDFKSALDEIAREMGVKTWDDRRTKSGGPKIDEAEMRRLWLVESERGLVFNVMSEIVHICWQALPSRVREHLKSHYMLTDDFIDLEKIGWVPEGLWDLCVERLPHRTKDDLLQSGFFNNPRDGSVPSPYQGSRILHPYWKEGRCVYTIAREYLAGVPREQVHIEEWEKSKFKKHAGYDKEKRPHVSPYIDNGFFYGEDQLPLATNGRLIITEGISDAAMLIMLGFPTISPVTVTFRKQDIERTLAMVKRYRVREIVIMNDNDLTTGGRRPGFEGAKRMANVLHAEGIKVRIARLPRPDGVAKVDVNSFCGDIIRSFEQ